MQVILKGIVSRVGSPLLVPSVLAGFNQLYPMTCALHLLFRNCCYLDLTVFTKPHIPPPITQNLTMDMQICNSIPQMNLESSW